MEKAIKRTKINVIKILVAFLVFNLLFLNQTFAATLNLSPSVGTYNQNQNFSVGVFVSSPNESMNAASAVISFPTDKLQIVSVSKSGSIVDFWPEEPSFSNTNGTIKIDGVILNPGYKGTNGRILTITFRGRNVGTAPLTFSSSSILANDGLGTSISKGVSGASFVIVEAPIKEPEIIQVDELKPILDEDLDICEPDSIITSSTHPGIVWRRENTAVFSWGIDNEILVSKVGLDKNPNTEPTEINSPAIAQKRYENLEDGIWYFHLALQDNKGWRKTEHFKIKVDNTPPSIEAREIKRGDLTDPRIVVNIKVTDKTSCVRDFEFSINGEIIGYEKLANGDLRLNKLSPGEHELVITAYDMAGNKNQKFLDIVVNPLPAPEITSYKSEISVGETLIIEGKTIPNGNVEAKITSKKNNFLIKQEFQSASGRFTLQQDKLKKGTIFISFRVSDPKGAQSQWSHPIEIKIKGDSTISFDKITNLLGTEITIIVGVIMIILIIIITRSLTIRKIRRELGL